MAKNQLPSIDDSVKQTDKPKEQTAIDPPMLTEGYIPRRVDAKLTREQARILRDKLRQLQDDGAKTADGRFVGNRTQAIQWILENEVAT